MRKIIILVLCSLALFGCNLKNEEKRPPNIIYFLADDLGYGEVGAFGQKKIKTPKY